MKTLFKVNIFTYLFFLLFMLAGFIKDALIIYIILFCHELGHVFFMRLFKIEIYSVTFYPYGGMIKSNILLNTNSFKVLIISLGGILIQLLLFIVFNLLNKCGIINTGILNIFYKYNISIILFNLLPLYPLDGMKIMNSILEMFIPYKFTIYICITLNVIFLLLFFSYLYIYKVSNYIIVLFLLVSLINYIKNIKYIINKFYIERLIYNFKYKGIISIKDIKYLYKNKLNYIGSIKEDIYFKKLYFNLI